VHLPKVPKGKRYYSPSDSGHEKTIKERIKSWEEKKKGKKM
jgi:replication-associated recombination protein RarA